MGGGKNEERKGKNEERKGKNEKGRTKNEKGRTKRGREGEVCWGVGMLGCWSVA
jgi:hypothetical protein